MCFTSNDSNDCASEAEGNSITDRNIYHTIIQLISSPRVRDNIALVKSGLK